MSIPEVLEKYCAKCIDRLCCFVPCKAACDALLGKKTETEQEAALAEKGDK